MGCAEIIAFEEVRASKHWATLRHQLHERFDQWLDTLGQQWHEPPVFLPEMTATGPDLRQQLTGGITETIIKYAHASERQRTQARCPRCARVLKVQEPIWRTGETMVGPVVWWRTVNSVTCSQPRCSWSPKCRMPPPSRSVGC